MSQLDVIDWIAHDVFPELNCSCHCGTVFRSHVKFIGSPPRIVARKRCPGCGGAENIISSASEPFEIR